METLHRLLVVVKTMCQIQHAVDNRQHLSPVALNVKWILKFSCSTLHPVIRLTRRTLATARVLVVGALWKWSRMSSSMSGSRTARGRPASGLTALIVPVSPSLLCMAADV